jgi:hypothetical protein
VAQFAAKQHARPWKATPAFLERLVPLSERRPQPFSRAKNRAFSEQPPVSVSVLERPYPALQKKKPETRAKVCV